MIDQTVAHPGRAYAYLLGDEENTFAPDRMLAEELCRRIPGSRRVAIENRQFLVRAVSYLAEEFGVRQFLDIGAGLPTENNVHQVAQAIDPDTRIVYVDNDPVILVHGQHLLVDNTNTVFIPEDLRNVEAILDHPDTQRLIHPDEPLVVLLNSVLHCIPDADDPAGIIRRFIDHIPDGSFLVLAHLTSEDPAVREEATTIALRAMGGNWGRVRDPQEIVAWLDGLDRVELLPPGLGELPKWRPDPAQPRIDGPEPAWREFGGVVVKR